MLLLVDLWDFNFSFQFFGPGGRGLLSLGRRLGPRKFVTDLESCFCFFYFFSGVFFGFQVFLVFFLGFQVFLVICSGFQVF